MAKQVALGRSRLAELKPVLADEALYGPIGQAVREMCEGGAQDPAALLGSLLTQFGNALGDGVTTDKFGKPAPRLFTLIVGDPGRGKGKSLNAVDELMARVAPSWVPQRKLADGMNRTSSTLFGWLPTQDFPNRDRRVMHVEEETERLLAAARFDDQIPQRLKVLWDGKEIRLSQSYSHKVGGEPVTETKVSTASGMYSFLGHITPGQFAKVADGFAQGGLETRIMIVACDAEDDSWDEPAMASDTTAATLAEALTAWRRQTFATVFDTMLAGLKGTTELESKVIPISKAVLAFKPSYWKDQYANGVEIPQAVERMFDNAARVALIYAIVDNAEEITEAHWRAAMAYWSYTALSAQVLFTTPDLIKPVAGIREVMIDKLLVALTEARKSGEGWVSQTEIIRTVFGGNRTTREIALWVTELGDQVESRKVRGTGGRPRIDYRLAGV